MPGSHLRTLTGVIGLATATALLAGCGSHGEATAYATGSAGSITLSDGWVAAVDGAMAGMSVTSMPSLAGSQSAAYATLRDTSATPDALVSVSTSAAGSATLYGTDAAARTITIPAQGGITLTPGGSRVVLAQLSGASFAPGTSISLTWHFRSGTALTTTLPVIDPADRPGAGR